MRFILLFCFTLLYGKYYSIQVLSSKNIKETLKVYKHLKDYPFSRIEYIKKYYTIRVGLREDEKKLKPLLKKVRLKYKDAFLRDVKFLKNRIIICNYKKRKSSKQHLVFDLIKNKLSFRELNLSKIKSIKQTNVKFEPYIDLSMALLTNDKEKLKKIVTHKRLPYRDKVQGLIKAGMINKAAQQIYKNLKNNSIDYEARRQGVDFYTVYERRLKFVWFLQRNDKIDTLNSVIGLKSFNKGIKFNQNILIKNSNTLYKNLKNLYSLSFFIKYKKLKTDVSFNKAYKNFMGVKFDWNVYTNLNLELGLNQKSDESIYLLYGGKKNFVNLIYNYFLDNRHYFSSNVKYNLFYTQNNKYVGSGENFNIRYTDNLRVGYPDFSYYVFFNQGLYKQSENADFLMANFSTVSNFDVLPDKFYIIGNGISFGVNNLDTLSPRLLPFGDFSVNYEMLKKNLGYNILFGFRKRLFYEDNLMMGVNYSKVLNKANTNPFIKFVLRYYYWF